MTRVLVPARRALAQLSAVGSAGRVAALPCSALLGSVSLSLRTEPVRLILMGGARELSAL